MNEFDDMEMKPDKDLERARKLLVENANYDSHYDALAIAIAQLIKDVRDETIKECISEMHTTCELEDFGNQTASAMEDALLALKGGEK